MVGEEQYRPRIGVPWRTAQEQTANKRDKFEHYLCAVREAGGEPVEVPLTLPGAQLEDLIGTLDAVVLPGSPADVDPTRYGAGRHERSAEPDPQRERTDYALLEHAFAAKKPVLAICYGTQLLNVYLGGTLIQDIPSEPGMHMKHEKDNLSPGTPDLRHRVLLEGGSQLAKLARDAHACIEPAGQVEVNSSHHQAILTPGRNLRVTAHAPDGIIEAVEWTGDANRVLGVQWHPERMTDDALAQILFRDLVAAARAAMVRG